MSLVLRSLPLRCAGGPWHMGADDALLASAQAGIASLRFYTWNEPTLSLGYFQACGIARAYPGLADLPWLRRQTGGAALVHHHEVTYSLALPPGSEWQPPGASWLCRMHHYLREVLLGLGAETALCADEIKRGDVFCFLHHTPGDLFIGEHKVVGSAQRKQRGALLQHGGILLARSPHAPLLPGLNDLTRATLSPEGVARAVGERMARETGLCLEPGAWTAEEEHTAGELAGSRYGSARWNERR